MIFQNVIFVAANDAAKLENLPLCLPLCLPPFLSRHLPEILPQYLPMILPRRLPLLLPQQNSRKMGVSSDLVKGFNVCGKNVTLTMTQ